MKISAQLPVTKRNLTATNFVNATNYTEESYHSQISSMVNKNANEALKNNALSYISFTGTTQNWDIKSVYNKDVKRYETSIVLQDGNSPKECAIYAPGNYKDSYHLRGLISNHSMMYPNSSIEYTKNNYITHRVYFADPEEVVNAQTKKDHDYIIYDNRPSYPTLSQIRENYFNTEVNAENYGRIFENIGEYYYRLEMADKKELEKLEAERKEFQPEFDRSLSYKNMIDSKIENTPWYSQKARDDREKADYYFSLNNSKMENYNQKIGYYQDRMNFAQEQQQKAYTAYKLFNEVGPMFFERDEARNKYQLYETNIPRMINHEIPDYQQKIKDCKAEKERLETERDQYQKECDAIETYKKYQKKSGQTVSAEQKRQMDSDKYMLLDKIQQLSYPISKQEYAINCYTNLIKEAEEYIKTSTPEIPILKEKFAAKSEEIKPYFNKMEEFYKNNIEEWQYS